MLSAAQHGFPFLELLGTSPRHRPSAVRLASMDGRRRITQSNIVNRGLPRRFFLRNVCESPVQSKCAEGAPAEAARPILPWAVLWSARCRVVQFANLKGRGRGFETDTFRPQALATHRSHIGRTFALQRQDVRDPQDQCPVIGHGFNLAHCSVKSPALSASRELSRAPTCGHPLFRRAPRSPCASASPHLVVMRLTPRTADCREKRVYQPAGPVRQLQARIPPVPVPDMPLPPSLRPQLHGPCPLRGRRRTDLLGPGLAFPLQRQTSFESDPGNFARPRSHSQPFCFSQFFRSAVFLSVPVPCGSPRAVRAAVLTAAEATAASPSIRAEAA